MEYRARGNAKPVTGWLMSRLKNYNGETSFCKLVVIAKLIELFLISKKTFQRSMNAFCEFSTRAPLEDMAIF